MERGVELFGKRATMVFPEVVSSEQGHKTNEHTTDASTTPRNEMSANELWCG